ncbi:MAG: diguanylate cyclase [Ruminococcaceae bacterium]|nr:diguanylate cyclase [Oscillospiraceae bacterium]
MWKSEKNRVVIITTLIGLLISSLLTVNSIFDAADVRMLEARYILDNQIASIQNEFLVNINFVYELRALIIGSEGKTVDPQVISERILKNPNIRNVLYAPDSIVKYVYPLEGNESVIGLDLLCADNKSCEDAKLAIDSGDIILTGPYELKQGGEAFSARLAIELPNEETGPKYHGLASITMDFPGIISKNVNILFKDFDFDFVLEKKLPNSDNYIEIYSQRLTDRDEFIWSDFSVANMNFRLSIVPQSGWFNNYEILFKILIAIVASISIGLFAGRTFTTKQELLKKSRIDALTGVYNRAGGTYAINSLIKSNLYKNGVFVMMDLDHFKTVNDVLGHQTGDEVLVSTASILKSSVRSTDVVARLGGDEFMLYLPFENDSRFVEKNLKIFARDWKKRLKVQMEQ